MSAVGLVTLAAIQGIAGSNFEEHIRPFRRTGDALFGLLLHVDTLIAVDAVPCLQMLYQFAILARGGIEWNGSKLSRTHGEQRDSGAPGVVFCDKKNLGRIVHTGSDPFQNRADAIKLSRFTTRRRQPDKVCAVLGKDVITPLRR